MKSLSLMLIFGAWLMTGEAQTVSLQLQNDYTNGGTTYAPSSAVGDVNNDGRPDLVAANRASGPNWYVAQSADFELFGDKFGASGDTAVPSAFIP